MGTEDYTASIGGSLKLKGVKDSKVTKHKGKKKHKKPKEEQNDGAPEGAKTKEQALDRALASEEEKEKEDDAETQEDIRGVGKTEAEKRHEERRRKRVGPSSYFSSQEAGLGARSMQKRRSMNTQLTNVFLSQLDERLKREGIKTHKERVEELNRYLSNLSEHHDMPRIGPG
ncbi:hypothetical protein MMC30_008322 [Trapelia coarctata]|nr:hypothetical protein [Trapelia coarctata]